MPELPEVETIARDLRAAGIVGRTLACAGVFWPRTIGAPAPEEFCRRVAGRRVAAVRRRGKYLIIDLEEGAGSVLVHLRMSGRLHLVAAGGARGPHEHAALTFTDGRELRLHDTRKFGRVYWTAAPESFLRRLGPEPLDPGFTARRLAAMLSRRKRRLKPLLLDQAFIAGLGNIYVDEALWEARLNPLRPAHTLTAAEARALHRAIRRVLARGLENLGTSLGTGKANFYSVGRRRGRNRDALRVFRRTGEPCPRCGAAVRRMVVGQRGTHICPRCQPEAAGIEN
jgi:formamidopyrimidine-DNA glycosylase